MLKLENEKEKKEKVLIEKKTVYYTALLVIFTLSMIILCLKKF